MNKYFYVDGEKKYGPFSKEELKNCKISRKTKIWYYGIDNWTELSNISELSDVLNSIPPQLKSKHTAEESTQKIELELLNPEKLTDTSPRKQKRKISLISKFYMVIVAIILVSSIAYTVMQNQSEVSFYNEIVANSYDSDEDFDMYVQKFYRDLEFYGIYPKRPKVTIIKFSKFDQIDKGTHLHGVSLGMNNDEKIEIYINPSSWRQFNKPMKYFLMYHELTHDVLNIDDLKATTWNEGKLMYPEISSYEKKSMDDFIESFHALFEELSIN